jgi:hypothetical protein
MTSTDAPGRSGTWPDNDELLHRQVYPTWLVDEGEPSSQAFYPWRTRDEGRLSVDRGGLASAREAFELFTSPRPNGFGQPSSGVWSLALSEVREAGLVCRPDPVAATTDGPANPAHALVDFNGIPTHGWKRTGRRLKAKAIARGRQYP